MLCLSGGGINKKRVAEVSEAGWRWNKETRDTGVGQRRAKEQQART